MTYSGLIQQIFFIMLIIPALIVGIILLVKAGKRKNK